MLKVLKIETGAYPSHNERFEDFIYDNGFSITRWYNLKIGRLEELQTHRVFDYHGALIKFDYKKPRKNA